MSRDIAKKNEVSIEKLLNSIQVFHEVICKEFPGAAQDHPYLQLYSDGSGCITGTRTAFRGDKDKYPNGVFFAFSNLVEFVKKVDELSKKHNIVWVEI